MSMVNIDDEIYKRIKPIVEANTVEYPTIQNYINKTLKRALDRHDDRLETKKLMIACGNAIKTPTVPQIHSIVEEMGEDKVHKGLALKRKEKALDKLHKVAERHDKGIKRVK